MATKRKANILNGVNVRTVQDLAGTIQTDPNQGMCTFHIQNKWMSGGHNRSRIKSFFSGGTEIRHLQPFLVDADEPAVLAGKDKGANPVEHLLHALAGCLTSSIVYFAALKGIPIESLESDLEGDLDLRGFMGLSSEVRKGYQNIRVTFRVQTDAKNLDLLQSFTEFSPVFDVVRNGTSVNVEILKK